MSVDAAVRAQERVCRQIGAAHERDNAGDETGPQNGPEWPNEWVVDLYAEHSGVRCERVVRCRNCARATCGETFGGIRTLVCRRFQSFNHETTPDGFCAWGELRED